MTDDATDNFSVVGQKSPRTGGDFSSFASTFFAVQRCRIAIRNMAAMGRISGVRELLF
jgi:ribosomal protein S14